VNSQALFEAFVDVSLRHAERLREFGPIRVLALDPCPTCMGRVVASEVAARCVACGWSYRDDGVEPLASRRADQ
jgi:hypothetical protein